MKPGEQKLTHTIQKLRKNAGTTEFTDRPTSGAEFALSERLKALSDQVNRLEQRVNQLLAAVAATILIFIIETAIKFFTS